MNQREQDVEIDTIWDENWPDPVDVMRTAAILFLIGAAFVAVGLVAGWAYFADHKSGVSLSDCPVIEVAS